MIFGKKNKPRQVSNPSPVKNNPPKPVPKAPENSPGLSEAFSKENLIQKTDVFSWNVTEVGQWLTFIGMDEYRITFLENSISGEELMELNEKDLTSLGIKKMGDRKSLLKRIAMLKTRKPFEEDAASTTSENSNEDSNSIGSSSSSAPIGEFQVKCYLPNGEIQILDINSCSIAEVKSKILTEFDGEYVVKYKDEDGDMILLHTDNDVRRCIRNGTLKLYLTPLNDLSPQECQTLEQIVDGVTIIDKKGTILFMNGRCLKMFGYSREEVLGKNVRILMNKNDARNHATYIKNYLETGFARIIGKGRVVQCLRSDGTPFGARLLVTEKRDPSGRHIFTGTLIEIEDQESINLTSVVNSWTVFDSNLDPSVVINDNGIILFFNKAAEKLWGYAKNEVQNTNVKILMPQPFRDQHDKFISNYNKSGVSKVIGTGREVPIQRKDGTIKRMLLKLNKQEINHMNFFVGVVTEVTESSKQVKSLLEQERGIINSLLIPGVMIDSSGTIQAWNSACEQLFGYQLEEVLGQNINLIMIGEEKTKHDGYLKRYLETKNSKILGRGRKVVAQKKDGSIININLWVSEKSEGEKKIFTGILQPVD